MPSSEVQKQRFTEQGPFLRRLSEGHASVSAPDHLEESAGLAGRQQTDCKRQSSQMLDGHPVFLLHENQGGHRATDVKASLVEREVR